MSLKQKLLTFVFLPSVLINIQNSSNSVVKSSATSQATGENAKTETSIETTVNGQKTVVKSNSSGQIEVETNNGQTTIKTSQSVTPTIIITGVPTEKIKIEEIKPTEMEKEKVIQGNSFKLKEVVQNLFQKLLKLIKFW